MASPSKISPITREVNIVQYTLVNGRNENIEHVLFTGTDHRPRKCQNLLQNRIGLWTFGPSTVFSKLRYVSVPYNQIEKFTHRLEILVEWVGYHRSQIFRKNIFLCLTAFDSSASLDEEYFSLHKNINIFYYPLSFGVWAKRFL